MRETAQVPPAALAEARFVLAQALWHSDRERPRAFARAEQARDAWRDVGKAAKQVAEVEAWLQEHGRAR